MLPLIILIDLVVNYLFNNHFDRIEAIKALGYADEVILEEYEGQKIDDIKKWC